MDKESIRSAVRPMILFMLTFGTFFIIIEGVTGQWVDAWVALTIAGDGEYILERPVLKMLGKA